MALENGHDEGKLFLNTGVETCIASGGDCIGGGGDCAEGRDVTRFKVRGMGQTFASFFFSLSLSLFLREREGGGEGKRGGKKEEFFKSSL